MLDGRPVGGFLDLPLAVAAYCVVIPMAEHSAHLTFPHWMLDVGAPGAVALLGPAGVAIRTRRGAAGACRGSADDRAGPAHRVTAAQRHSSASAGPLAV